MAKDTKLPDIGGFFDAFGKESDRAAGVLGAALLDLQLERVFRARLVADAPDSLYAFHGPLGDFAGRIDVAYAFGWIDVNTHADLHIVRKIRNDFAHQADHELTFNDQSIADRVKNLSVRRQWLLQIEPIGKMLSDARPEMESEFNTLRTNLDRARHQFGGTVTVLVGLLMTLQNQAWEATRPSPTLESYFVEMTHDMMTQLLAVTKQALGEK